MRRRGIALVGGKETIARGDTDAVMRFYGGLFSRLAQEVPGLGELTRYVGFQRRVSEGAYAHFFGIEVEAGENGSLAARIPEGMLAWDLRAGEQIVWRHREAAPSRSPITWAWLDRPPSGRWTGEYCRDGERPWWISAHAYVDPSAAAPDDAVALVDPDPAWADQYREMAGWLRHRLGPEIALRTEHYGSTAIPGIPAKPIVDMLIEVPSFAAAKRKFLPALNDERWEYWWYNDHMMFIRRARRMGPRTHHLHLAPRGHRLWEGLAFRDYLRAHPQTAARYAALKRELAQAHRQDREAYTEAKTTFVRQITARALS